VTSHLFVQCVKMCCIPVINTGIMVLSPSGNGFRGVGNVTITVITLSIVY
jgi:hypothetical protein